MKYSQDFFFQITQLKYNVSAFNISSLHPFPFFTHSMQMPLLHTTLSWFNFLLKNYSTFLYRTHSQIFFSCFTRYEIEQLNTNHVNRP